MRRARSLEPCLDALVGSSSNAASELTSIDASHFREVCRRLGDDAARELVAVEAGVVIRPAALGRDDVGGVAGDQVEGSRRRPARRDCRAGLDVRDAVERGADVREGQCRSSTLVVTTCPVWRAPRAVHGAVAGADVDSAPGRPADGERGEPVRGRSEARDPAGRVVGAPGEAVEGEVDALGRHDPGAWHELAVHEGGEAERVDRVDPARSERGRGGGFLDRLLQEEEAHDGRHAARGKSTGEDGTSSRSAAGPSSREASRSHRSCPDRAQHPSERRRGVGFVGRHPHRCRILHDVGLTRRIVPMAAAAAGVLFLLLAVLVAHGSFDALRPARRVEPDAVARAAVRGRRARLPPLRPASGRHRRGSAGRALDLPGGRAAVGGRARLLHRVVAAARPRQGRGRLVDRVARRECRRGRGQGDRRPPGALQPRPARHGVRPVVSQRAHAARRGAHRGGRLHLAPRVAAPPLAPGDGGRARRARRPHPDGRRRRCAGRARAACSPRSTPARGG